MSNSRPTWETKIDGTYPNSQFAIKNYYLYRNDRVKGGGGLMAYFSSVLPSKHLKQPKVFKTIEVLPIQSKFGGKDVTMWSSNDHEINFYTIYF